MTFGISGILGPYRVRRTERERSVYKMYTVIYSFLNDEIMAINKLILFRFDFDFFYNSTFCESNRFSNFEPEV